MPWPPASLTIFSIPKGFSGDDGRVQRNALFSWVASGADVILFGDDPGVAEAATSFGVGHYPQIARNKHGRPLLDGVFAEAQRVARTPVVCYLNADIIVLPEFSVAVSLAHLQRSEALLVARRVEMELGGSLECQKAWVKVVRAQAQREGLLATEWAIDGFAFARGAVARMPPFAVGKPGWDNWMIHYFLQSGRPVVDLTPVSVLIHQDLEPGWARGKTVDHADEQSAHNLDLAGRGAWFSIHDATHRLRGGRMASNLSASRVRQRLRRAAREHSMVRRALAPFRWMARRGA